MVRFGTKSKMIFVIGGGRDHCGARNHPPIECDVAGSGYGLLRTECARLDAGVLDNLRLWKTRADGLCGDLLGENPDRAVDRLGGMDPEMNASKRRLPPFLSAGQTWRGEPGPRFGVRRMRYFR